MGEDQNGNGSCPELVSGGDSLSWESGIYPGKDIGVPPSHDRRAESPRTLNEEGQVPETPTGGR